MQKKFIGTLSLNINTHDLNYGALLHSWAFQQFIVKKLNFKTEIIDYITPMLENNHLKYPIVDAIKKKNFRNIIVELFKMYRFARRFDKFQKFIKKNCIVSKVHYNQEKLNNATLHYDTIICESDVIWSTDFFGGDFDKSFFCYLDSMNEVRKIIYSASMANANLNEKQANKMQEMLMDLDYISCRESYSVEIIRKYTDKKISHVLDPVLLLEPNDYNNIVSQNKQQKKYLLVYMPVGNNNFCVEQAVLYSRKYDLEVIEISNSLRNIFKHRVIRDAGIEEFLALIRNAEIIFTDSFHAVCFSLIFHKEFYAFTRKTGRKIEDICKQVNLLDRFIVNEFKEQEKIDFNKIDKILSVRKKESIDFLKAALSI